VEFLGEVLAWYVDPERWSGRDSLPTLFAGHIGLSAAALAVALGIAVPLGLYIGHTGRAAQLVVAVSNIGRAVPSLGWLGIAYPITTGLFARSGHGFLPGLVALVALAVPPIVTNTYAGLHEVDADLREAGRGMGMTEMQLLRRVEVPAALPVILAGVRSAAVAVVATAPLMSIVGADTLGDYILAGLSLGDQVQVFSAAVLVALVAVLTELGFALLQRRAVSPGLVGPLELAASEPAQLARIG
jgi:osmoprotectant transport system permease protein